MIGFGVSVTTPSSCELGSGHWNTKAYHYPIVYYVFIHSSQDEGVVTETPKPIITPIVYYVYIHSSQEEGVFSETPKPIIARWCTMCTYIVHKTREWSLKHQSISLPNSVLCLHTKFTRRGSGLWNTKAYPCPIVYFVYIHSSQHEGLVSEAPKSIIAR